MAMAPMSMMSVPDIMSIPPRERILSTMATPVALLYPCMEAARRALNPRP